VRVTGPGIRIRNKMSRIPNNDRRFSGVEDMRVKKPIRTEGMDHKSMRVEDHSTVLGSEGLYTRTEVLKIRGTGKIEDKI
jgi:hypothetical protein